MVTCARNVISDRNNLHQAGELPIYSGSSNFHVRTAVLNSTIKKKMNEEGVWGQWNYVI